MGPQLFTGQNKNLFPKVDQLWPKLRSKHPMSLSVAAWLSSKHIFIINSFLTAADPDAPPCRNQLALSIIRNHDWAAQRVLYIRNTVSRLHTGAPGLLFRVRLPAFNVTHTYFPFETQVQKRRDKCCLQAARLNILGLHSVTRHTSSFTLWWWSTAAQFLF